MDFRIIWSHSALSDLRDLVRYISRDHKETARKYGDLLISKVDALKKFPRIGKMVHEYRTDCLRELSFPPYRIVYEIHDDTGIIAVLRIWHGARGDLELPQGESI